MKKQLGILSIVIVMIITQSSYAQYKLKSGSFGNGCAVSTNTANQVTGIAGQTFTDPASNAQYTAQAGFWFSVKMIIGLEDLDNHSPEIFQLKQNYPNPFNPLTRIHYSVPKTVNVKITVYNVLGQQVAVLVDKQKVAGKYEALFDASQLSSGMYIYKINAGEFSAVHKMILMK